MERDLNLAPLSDIDLFKLICNFPTEVKIRIIELLEEWGITQFSFDGDCKDYPSMKVWTYDSGDKNIDVSSVGYSIDRIGNRKLPDKNLYIIDKDDNIYCGEDTIINDTLWDVYHQMKEYIK